MKLREKKGDEGIAAEKSENAIIPRVYGCVVPKRIFFIKIPCTMTILCTHRRSRTGRETTLYVLIEHGKR